MLIFHNLSDLDNVGDEGSAIRSLANSVLANAETRIVYRQGSDQLGPTATALGLAGTEQTLLPNLGVGQGLWRIKNRSFVIQHQLHPGELELFDTSSRLPQESSKAQASRPETPPQRPERDGAGGVAARGHHRRHHRHLTVTVDQQPHLPPAGEV